MPSRRFWCFSVRAFRASCCSLSCVWIAAYSFCCLSISACWARIVLSLASGAGASDTGKLPVVLVDVEHEQDSRPQGTGVGVIPPERLGALRMGSHAHQTLLEAGSGHPNRRDAEFDTVERGL